MKTSNPWPRARFNFKTSAVNYCTYPINCNHGPWGLGEKRGFVLDHNLIMILDPVLNIIEEDDASAAWRMTMKVDVFVKTSHKETSQ